MKVILSSGDGWSTQYSDISCWDGFYLEMATWKPLIDLIIANENRPSNQWSLHGEEGTEDYIKLHKVMTDLVDYMQEAYGVELYVEELVQEYDDLYLETVDRPWKIMGPDDYRLVEELQEIYLGEYHPVFNDNGEVVKLPNEAQHLERLGLVLE